MRGLRAVLYKDLKLFFRKTGAAALLLPLALLLAFQLGLEGRGDYVQPFSVAVRDEDDTLMSRSLLSQIERIPLFEQLIRPRDGESDAQLLEQGAAAVVTIPKDFFYDLYTMSDCPVQVTLNRDMPLEATLFRSMFCSVIEIIRSDQAAWQGLYAFCYGDLDEGQRAALYAETSDSLLEDALGRQTIFTQEDGLESLIERRLLAALLAVTVLFFSLSAVKTLPEERALGVLPRFRAAGGSLAAFLLGKLLVTLLAILPALPIVLLGAGNLWTLLLVGLVLLLGAFGLLLAIAAWSSGPAAAQRWGNLLLLLSLVLGGGLWPGGTLPAFLAFSGRLTLPYYSLLGVEAACRGSGAGEVLRLLRPVLLMGAIGLGLGVCGLRRRSGWQRREMVPLAGTELPQAAPRGVWGRLTGMALVKLRGMTGGPGGLAVLLAAALICGAAASAQSGGREALRVAVCDLDQSAGSRELTERLRRSPELDIRLCDREEGSLLLLRGDVEGLCVIDRGYEEALRDGRRDGVLRYTEAASAVTAQGVREIIAGQSAAQYSRLRAARLAEERMGPLDEDGQSRLLNCIAAAERTGPRLYEIHTADGLPLPEPFVPGAMGFAALAVLFNLLTAAPWSGAAGRRVDRRLRSVPYGRLLSCGSDCLALTVYGFLTALAVLLPCGALDALPAALAYAFCTAGLAQALTRFTLLEGRVDGFAPFLALFLCLLGGCFLDLAGLPPVFRSLSLLTPTGLAVRAAEGSLTALAALPALGLLFLRAAAPGRGGA